MRCPRQRRRRWRCPCCIPMITACCWLSTFLNCCICTPTADTSPETLSNCVATASMSSKSLDHGRPLGVEKTRKAYVVSFLSQFLSWEPSHPSLSHCEWHFFSSPSSQSTVCHLTQPLKTASQLLRQNPLIPQKALAVRSLEPIDIANFQQKWITKATLLGTIWKFSHLSFSTFWIYAFF